MRIAPSLVLLAVAAGAACSDPSGTPPPIEPKEPGLHVISGPAATDTARAAPAAPLVVRLRGPDGEAIAGAEVRFEPLSTGRSAAAATTA